MKKKKKRKSSDRQETKFRRRSFIRGIERLSTIVFYRAVFTHGRSWRMLVSRGFDDGSRAQREHHIDTHTHRETHMYARAPATAKLISMEEISRHLASFGSRSLSELSKISRAEERSHGIVYSTNRWKFLPRRGIFPYPAHTFM